MKLVDQIQKEVILTPKGGKREGAGRQPKGLIKKTFSLTKDNLKQLDQLLTLPDYDDASHVARDAINKLHYERIEKNKN